jgi:hypothetical protein
MDGHTEKMRRDRHVYSQIGRDRVWRGGFGPDPGERGWSGIDRRRPDESSDVQRTRGTSWCHAAGGTYTFELIPLHPDIVRVLSRDGWRVYFTGFTMRVPRPASLPADALVSVAETVRGVAPRISAWYPIGASSGQAFRYPDRTR